MWLLYVSTPQEDGAESEYMVKGAERLLDFSINQHHRVRNESLLAPVTFRNKRDIA